MTDLEALRDEFAAAYESGESPDPSELLDRVEGDERQELELLIDRYLMTAPRRAWDPEAFERSAAKVAVERIFESREGVSGTWPELLPRLRNRARIRRAELVERLTAALGVGSAPTDVQKVAVYYNRMEHGGLPAEGVTDDVLGALAGIVGSTLDALRAAGSGAIEPPEGGAPAFARVAVADADYADVREERVAPPASPGAEPELERDRIDELFTGRGSR